MGDEFGAFVGVLVGVFVGALVVAFVGVFVGFLVGDFVGALTGGGFGVVGAEPFWGALVGGFWYRGCALTDTLTTGTGAGALTGTLTTGVGTGTLTTGIGTDAFTTTGCVCAKNALFLLEEVGAAFGYERFRPCKIRAIVLFTFIPTTAMLLYNYTKRPQQYEHWRKLVALWLQGRPTWTVRPHMPRLSSFSRRVHANDLISKQRKWSNHRIVTASTCSMKHLLLSKTGLSIWMIFGAGRNNPSVMPRKDE
jgi:hypothetical protein